MVDSARLGNPPLTSRDGLIQKALKTYRTNFNGNPRLPFGAQRPIPPSPDLAGESNAWRTKTAAATFICLIVIVTVGRFFFWWRRRQNWGLGLDDLLVTVAAAIALAYVGHILSAFVEGTCLGRHMWFCTYEDINTLYLVRIDDSMSLAHTMLTRSTDIHYWSNSLLLLRILFEALATLLHQADNASGPISPVQHDTLDLPPTSHLLRPHIILWHSFPVHSGVGALVPDHTCRSRS